MVIKEFDICRFLCDDDASAHHYFVLNEGKIRETKRNLSSFSLLRLSLIPQPSFSPLSSLPPPFPSFAPPPSIPLPLPSFALPSSPSPLYLPLPSHTSFPSFPLPPSALPRPFPPPSAPSLYLRPP